jgi:DNA ligase (NAD+)
LRKSVFEEYFVGADFANPRNTVSGTVRKKHGDRSLNRHLEMRFYDVIAEGRDFETEREKMDFLGKELCLELAVTYCDRDIESVRSIYRDYQGTDGTPGKRFKLDYEIDGLVVRADSIAKQKELGSIRNRPRFATAYKFPSVGQETVLRNVEWSLGLGSRVTPVARLEPVQVGGVTVSNATLHNPDYLASLGLRLGDRVLVERKGDVIPQVVRVVESQGGKKPAPPHACPTCASTLEVSGKHLRCPNPDCPGKSYGDLMRWIREMDIDSLGEKWVGILTEKGLLVDPVDLYTLTPQDLVPLERMGETLATKVVRNIQESCRPSLDVFVAALNIPEFSRQRAQLVIEAGYDSLKKLQEALVEDLAAVKGFGDILADKAVLGLQARKDIIERLLGVGIRIQKPPPESERTGPFVGKTFCFTGTIKKIDAGSAKTFTRNRMEALVKQRGGRALKAVTAKLDYLVMANPKSKSSKAEKARDLGTKILSEEEFFGMVGG